MADANFSAAAPSAHPTPHPMSSPGYGKRSAPDQLPRGREDFTHLPKRERAIAGYIDRLPDGSDISVKTLEKHLPYGQCALRTALNNLHRAGHLRRGREHVRGSGSAQWVTRTWFSRTARDDAWWTAFVRGDVPAGPTADGGSASARQPDTTAERNAPPTLNRAYVLLAALGHTAPALSLSHSECLRLAPLVTEWFERGATDADLNRALTAGLPSPVHSPAGLVHRRLTDKLPPEPVPRPVPHVLRMAECAKCTAPARPEALRGGMCAQCLGEAPPPTDTPSPLPPTAVRAHAARIRAAAATPTPARSRT
ncbi:hypothetical protein [Streptomyces sp. KLOTTS4A1]|uniref:hypothetical protein n=1 Tax=Streptomyces sp. KLOTTS4A1 TaxID=3390996 RepID=UPI0039F5B46F